MLVCIFLNCGHMCTISLYRFTSSHVQRVLVHVPMYTMYYLSVVLVLDKDVARLCSYRGEEWKTLYFPPFSPPWFFSRGEKFILHIIWILFMVKCLSFGALCSGVISYFATQLKVLALVEVYKIVTQKKHFHLCVERRNGRPSALIKSLFIH